MPANDAPRVTDAPLETIVLGMGCFWGAEKRMAELPGVVDVESGYANGEVPGTNRRLPVVALTAYALEGDRKRFLDAGMDEFVTKPCDMDQLLRTVAKVLGIKPAA